MKITSIINIQNPVVLKNFRMMKLIIKTKIKIFLILKADHENDNSDSKN